MQPDVHRGRASLQTGANFCLETLEPWNPSKLIRTMSSWNLCNAMWFSTCSYEVSWKRCMSSWIRLQFLRDYTKSCVMSNVSHNLIFSAYYLRSLAGLRCWQRGSQCFCVFMKGCLTVVSHCVIWDFLCSLVELTMLWIVVCTCR